MCSSITVLTCCADTTGIIIYSRLVCGLRSPPRNFREFPCYIGNFRVYLEYSVCFRYAIIAVWSKCAVFNVRITPGLVRVIKWVECIVLHRILNVRASCIVWRYFIATDSAEHTTLYFKHKSKRDRSQVLTPIPLTFSFNQEPPNTWRLQNNKLLSVLCRYCFRILVPKQV